MTVDDHGLALFFVWLSQATGRRFVQRVVTTRLGHRDLADLETLIRNREFGSTICRIVAGHCPKRAGALIDSPGEFGRYGGVPRDIRLPLYFDWRLVLQGGLVEPCLNTL